MLDPQRLCQRSIKVIFDIDTLGPLGLNAILSSTLMGLKHVIIDFPPTTYICTSLPLHIFQTLKSLLALSKEDLRRKIRDSYPFHLFNFTSTVQPCLGNCVIDSSVRLE